MDINRKREFIAELPVLFEVFELTQIIQLSSNVFKIILEREDYTCMISVIDLNDKDALDELQELIKLGGQDTSKSDDGIAPLNPQ